MKTILSFIDWYTPGYKAGGTIRAFSNMVSYLKEDFEFYIITRNTDYTETKPYSNILSNTWTTVDKNIHVFYASDDYISYANWKDIMKNISYDSLYIHGIFSYWFSILPLIINKQINNKKILVASHGMLGDHAFSVKPLKKNTFLRMIKLVGLYKGVTFHAANQDEESDIRKRIGDSAQIFIADELPMNRKLEIVNPPAKEKGKLKLIYLARISPEKNLKFGLEILKEINSGKIELDIFGPVYNETYWKECQEIIAKLPAQISVVYRGSLKSDKVIEGLQKYHAMFLPTSGENFGHAILESLMAGRPVIISDQTPWKKLERFGAGFDCPLDDKTKFKHAIQTLLDFEQQEMNSMSQSTIQFIKSYILNPEGLKENIKMFNPSAA